MLDVLTWIISLAALGISVAALAVTLRNRKK